MKLKSFIFCIFTLLCLQSTDKILSYHAEVETFFLPQGQQYIYADLTSFLYRAEHKILVAMYWLTDDDIIAKLIKLKKRGIDVQIIFDESTTQIHPNIITEFLTNNIVPIVFPIITTGQNDFRINGFMHNKFVVIDNSAVWTGSANFTSIVLEREGPKFNYENIAIITSPDAAQQYSESFFFIEKSIIKLYLQMLATKNIRDLPDWLIRLCLALYQSNRQFKASLHEFLPQFSTSEQKKLFSFFPESRSYIQQAPQQIPSAEHSQYVPLTEKELRQIESMEVEFHSKDNPPQQVQSFQTDDPMWEELRENIGGHYTYMEEATPKQKKFLKKRGFECYVSKNEAAEMIEEIKETEEKTGQKYMQYPYD